MNGRMGGGESRGQRQVAAVFNEGTGTASGISYKGKWEGAHGQKDDGVEIQVRP